jgi:uncharacterized protein (DUF952 family)
MSLIYKIVDTPSWCHAIQSGEFTGAAIDRQDGFIHFSAANQVAETLQKHFARKPDLMLITVDADLLGEALKWEVSRADELFPHLYGNLPISAVVDQIELPVLPDGSHHLPDGFESS